MVLAVIKSRWDCAVPASTAGSRFLVVAMCWKSSIFIFFFKKNQPRKKKYKAAIVRLARGHMYLHVYTSALEWNMVR